MEGIFAVYKPKGLTSYQVVEIIKKLTGVTRVGHGGTLDPFAEGVLVVAVGRKYTKQLHNILKNSKKEYIAEILLDRSSDTYDITGNITYIKIFHIPTLEEIQNVISNFIGEILQTPPVYSAVKIKGRRICDLIREGKLSIEEATKMVKPKKVVIESIEILEYFFPLLKLKIVCNSGVYIRSLSRDIGEKLSCGNTVKSLIRTRVGDYTLSECKKIV